VLDTDALDTMVRDLAESGIREVTGAFRIATDALPAIYQIDPAQLPYVGYNPSISALNLNFNRVFFEWERTGEEYTVRMDARSDNHSPMVTVSRMTIEPRDYPVYTFDGPRRGTNGPSRKAHWATGAGAGCRCAARPPISRRCSRCSPAPGGSNCPRRWCRKAPRRAQTFWWSMKARR
jgi:hypothetical protein